MGKGGGWCSVRATASTTRSMILTLDSLGGHAADGCVSLVMEQRCLRRVADNGCAVAASPATAAAHWPRTLRLIRANHPWARPRRKASASLLLAQSCLGPSHGQQPSPS